ncbi:hypothetical protein [Mammaliicoccus sp. M-M49]|nr:hypothetical protein [Mammaliicoccus sp. M-M49]
MIKTYYVNLNGELKETNSPKDISEEKKWIWVDLNDQLKKNLKY